VREVPVSRRLTAGLCGAANRRVWRRDNRATEPLASAAILCRSISVAWAVLVWCFRHERIAPANLDTVERRAATAVGEVMIAVALYLTASAVKRGAAGEQLDPCYHDFCDRLSSIVGAPPAESVGGPHRRAQDAGRRLAIGEAVPGGDAGTTRLTRARFAVQVPRPPAGARALSLDRIELEGAANRPPPLLGAPGYRRASRVRAPSLGLLLGRSRSRLHQWG
jgi:hypothetical protein